MTAAAPHGRVAVTGIGVIAPWGDDPAAAVAGGPLSAPAEGWFDVRTRLAPRGYKYLPPACQYLLAAAKRARAQAAGPAGPVATGAGLGVVIGTNRACSAVHAAMDHTVLTTDAGMLSPALAPFFSINVVASRLSIEQDCRAFNLTLTSPAVAGLESMQVAARALALGRARAVFAGATEAVAPPPDAPGQPAEAGAAVLLLERPESAARRGAPVFGTCHSRALFAPPHAPDQVRAALAAVWDELTGEQAERGAAAQSTALRGSALQGTAIRDGSIRDGTPPTLFADGSPVADAAARALAECAGGVSVLPLGAGCVGPTWHVAGLLAAGGAPALVAVAHRTGHVVLTAVRPAPATRAAGPTRPEGSR